MALDEYKEDSFGFMKEYIFYTTECSTQAPDGEDVENCQLLVRSYGNDKNDVLQNLLKKNPWIEKRVFDPSGVNGLELA